MGNKYLLAVAAAIGALGAAAVAVFLVRRRNTEPAPVSPTVPRVEELPLSGPVGGDGAGSAAS